MVATKADKIKRSQLQKHISMIKKSLQMKPEDVLVPVSALKKTGHQELLDEIEKILDMRTVIDRQLKECGFVYSSVDLNGFRSGSMNEGKHINYEY